MNNTFELSKGKIVFEPDRIVITDYARNEKITRVFTLTAGILLGVSYMVKYFKNNDPSDLRFGLLMGIPCLLPMVLVLLESVKSEIPLSEVKSLKIKRIFFKDHLYIKLTNNRFRRVSKILNAQRLEDYIITNL